MSEIELSGVEAVGDHDECCGHCESGCLMSPRWACHAEGEDARMTYVEPQGSGELRLPLRLVHNKMPMPYARNLDSFRLEDAWGIYIAYAPRQGCLEALARDVTHLAALRRYLAAMSGPSPTVERVTARGDVYPGDLDLIERWEGGMNREFADLEAERDEARAKLAQTEAELAELRAVVEAIPCGGCERPAVARNSHDLPVCTECAKDPEPVDDDDDGGSELDAAPVAEPTRGPKVGDRVTAANVGMLPVGTVVEWMDDGPRAVVRTDTDAWEDPLWGRAGSRSDAQMVAVASAHIRSFPQPVTASAPTAKGCHGCRWHDSRTITCWAPRDSATSREIEAWAHVHLADDALTPKPGAPECPARVEADAESAVADTPTANCSTCALFLRVPLRGGGFAPKCMFVHDMSKSHAEHAPVLDWIEADNLASAFEGPDPGPCPGHEVKPKANADAEPVTAPATTAKGCRGCAYRVGQTIECIAHRHLSDAASRALDDWTRTYLDGDSDDVTPLPGAPECPARVEATAPALGCHGCRWDRDTACAIPAIHPAAPDAAEWSGTHLEGDGMTPRAGAPECPGRGEA